MTHEEIVQCIYKCDYPSTCKGKKDCNPGDINCHNCAEELLTEYENKIRTKTLNAAMNRINDMEIADCIKMAIMQELSKMKGGEK